MISALLLLLFGYLMGSIPTGYWVVKALKGIDLRQVGSGSTGTTNVLRAAGKGPAAFVFFIDIIKGTIPVWLSIFYVSQGALSPIPIQYADWLPFFVGIIALVGHSKSIFLNFTGGKSAATSLGVVIAMNWMAASTSFLFFVLIVASTRFVSLGSMLAVGTSCVVMWYFTPTHPSYWTFCGLGGLYIIFRHRANIKRLMNGTEPRIGQKIDGEK